MLTVDAKHFSTMWQWFDSLIATHEMISFGTKQKFTSCEYEIVVYLYVGKARVYMMPPYFWQTSNAMTPFVCGATMSAFNDECGSDTSFITFI